METYLPDFLKIYTSPEEIIRKMMQSMPDTIDKTEGGILWDLFMPVALEKSEIIEFYMPRIINIMFPQYAEGEWLDRHGQLAPTSVVRLKATKAKGYVTVTGTPGTAIAAGTVLSTERYSELPAVSYRTDAASLIEESGTVDIAITALEAGTAGNVGAGLVILMASPILRVTSVTNPEPLIGGTDDETDDALRERILAAYQTEDNVFTGAPRDYIRWAKEVAGVGDAMVIPTWDGPGTVKLIVVDENGEPVEETTRTAVVDYIISPSDETARLAPIGATLTIITSTRVTLNVSSALTLAEGYTLVEIEAQVRAALIEYFKRAKIDGVVSTAKIGARMLNVLGVEDYASLTINGSTDNITIAQDEYPTIGTLTLTQVVAP